jgi:hypothetical protein
MEDGRKNEERKDKTKDGFFRLVFILLSVASIFLA